MELKTVQWNIGGGYIRNGDADPLADESYINKSVEYICEILKDLRPDVVTLQETHINKHEAQAEKIAQDIDFKILDSVLTDHYPLISTFTV